MNQGQSRKHTHVHTRRTRTLLCADRVVKLRAAIKYPWHGITEVGDSAHTHLKLALALELVNECMRACGRRTKRDQLHSPIFCWQLARKNARHCSAQRVPRQEEGGRGFSWFLGLLERAPVLVEHRHQRMLRRQQGADSVAKTTVRALFGDADIDVLQPVLEAGGPADGDAHTLLVIAQRDSTNDGKVGTALDHLVGRQISEAPRVEAIRVAD